MKKLLCLCLAASALCVQVPAARASAQAEAAPLDLGNFYAYWTDWEGIGEKKVGPATEETFSPQDRRWCGLPTICRTEGGRLWAGFMTGGFGEPDPLNYNAFHYSDDGGKTWSSASLVIDQKDENIGLYQPHLFMYDGKMQLWLNNAGQNVIEIDNPDCADPSSELHMTKAKKVLNYNSAHRPTILSEKWDNIWLFSAENSASNENAIFASSDGKKWEQYSSVTSVNMSRKWWEAQIVECADGTLIHQSRVENNVSGGMQLAYSYDGGETWTAAKGDNGRPFISYCNKAHMQRLESGNLLLLVAYSPVARENITAFLSEDNGKTWPYSLSLDARVQNGALGAGYPEAADLQGENGEIYAVWDARFSYAEIGCAVFTEDDIRAGKIVSENCFSFNSVMRGRTQEGYIYEDIEGVEEQFPREIEVPCGTQLREAVEELPDRLTAIYKGERISLTGSWECHAYDPETAGRYTFRFVTPDLPEGVADSGAYLTATVTVKERAGGCGSVTGIYALGAAAIGCGALVTVKNKSGKRSEKGR